MTAGVMGTLHGLDFVATSMLLGFIVFTSWIAPRTNSMPSGRRAYLRGMALVGIAAFLAAAYFLFTAADMADSWRLSRLWTVLTQTTFGHFFEVKCLCLVLLAGAVRASRWRTATIIVLVLPAAAALTGHAGAKGSALSWLTLTDFCHFAAVGIWTGGLLALILDLQQRLKNVKNEIAEAYITVRRFSHLAMISTGTIAISGCLLAYQYGVFRDWTLLETDYGQLVALKIGLFACALLSAAVNQFIHLRRWSAAKGQEFAVGIFRAACVELALAFLVFLVAGHLTMKSPPLS